MEYGGGMTLTIPEENERLANAILQEIQDLGATVFFEKPLTASDASGSGRVVIPKGVAEQYFPRLEQPSGLPVRAVDTRGHEYTFKFRFWINNQSRMYLLEGAGELHRQFRMAVGDVMVFAQKLDRTLVVAGRPATKTDVIRKAPVKRPAGAPGEKGKGKDGKSKGPKGAMDPARRKRMFGSQLDMEPPADGIFRGVQHMMPAMVPQGVAPVKPGRWVASLNLAGELYQAYFDSHEDAEEAYLAAGGLPQKPEDSLPGFPGFGQGLKQENLLGLTMGLGLGLGLGGNMDFNFNMSNLLHPDNLAQLGNISGLGLGGDAVAAVSAAAAAAAAAAMQGGGLSGAGEEGMPGEEDE